MRKNLILFLLTILLITSLGQETALATFVNDRETPSPQTLHLVQDRTAYGYTGAEGVGESGAPAANTRDPSRRRRGSGTVEEERPPEPTLYSLDQILGFVTNYSSEEGNPVLAGEQFLYSLTADDRTTRATLHWDWEINNIYGVNGDTTQRTPTTRIAHTFNYVGTYTFRGLPWTRFRTYRRFTYYVFVPQTVEVGGSGSLMDQAEAEAADAMTEAFAEEGLATELTPAVVFTREQRSFDVLINERYGYDYPRVVNYRAVIGPRDLNRLIEFPEDTSLPPLPRLRFELTE